MVFIKGYKSPNKGVFSNPIPRFWKYINKIDNGCWLWTGWKNIDGYGSISVKGKDIKAHRFSYELHKDIIPIGMFVLHICDNPPCVNPEHLFIGNNSDNMQDMRNKGRANDKNKSSGEKHYRHKLTIQQVQAIRKLFSTGQYLKIELGKMFSTSGSNITDIVTFTTWK